MKINKDEYYKTIAKALLKGYFAGLKEGNLILHRSVDRGQVARKVARREIHDRCEDPQEFT